MPIRLTVIGGGPGGYTAAFAAARAGMSVTLVESGNLGGTCLNNGCIPTKTLKASADALELALRLSQFGITGQGAPAVDPAAVLARKEKVCSTLRGGLEKACASLGVRLLKGRGRLVHAGLVEASTAEGPVSVEGDRVILATGSGALELPGLPVDHTHILTSDDALALDRVPASIAIVGGGVIGCELAFIYQAFGSKVTVVEGQNRLLPLPSVAAPAGNEETPHRLRAGPDAQGRARGGRHGQGHARRVAVHQGAHARTDEGNAHRSRNRAGHGGARAQYRRARAGRSRGRRGRAGLDTGR